MTKVFSGGLVYEYSDEGNGYGIVSISGNTVSYVDDQFTDLQAALANVTDPSNGGGYSTDGVTQTCPDQSDNWDTGDFTGSALPALPSGAEKYMKNGAGTGPGLTGDGSQNAGDASSATASAGAGAVSTTYGSGASSTGGSSSSSTSSSAAVQLASTDRAPFMCLLVMAVSMMFGAAIL